MKPISTPHIMEDKTAEQNIQSIKGWAYEIVGELNYKLLEMEDTIKELKAEIASLKEE